MSITPRDFALAHARAETGNPHLTHAQRFLKGRNSLPPEELKQFAIETILECEVGTDDCGNDESLYTLLTGRNNTAYGQEHVVAGHALIEFAQTVIDSSKSSDAPEPTDDSTEKTWAEKVDSTKVDDSTKLYAAWGKFTKALQSASYKYREPMNTLEPGLLPQGERFELKRDYGKVVFDHLKDELQQLGLTFDKPYVRDRHIGD